MLAGMNQLWRRNIKKADKAGVEVTRSTAERRVGDLHGLPRPLRRTPPSATTSPRAPLAYFRTMCDALGAEEPDRIRLYLARHEGDLVAATIWVRVGTHAWYSYGASSTEKRDVRGSNAVQWAMIRDALAAGADVYDLRGITDTLDADDRHVGLIQFKVGTGGEAVEYVGEWDLPLQPVALQGLRPLPERDDGSRSCMTLTLNVDGDRWRAHLRARPPSVTPRSGAGGQGQRLRLRRWAGWPARPSWLGRCDTLAVGTYDELPEVATRFPGDLLVLTPWRPFDAATLDAALADRVIHTVSRLEDLAGLLDGASRTPAFVLERCTACAGTA